MDAKQLRETVDELFKRRSQFMLLNQEIAENFYPQRADFTVRKEIGDEYMPDLMTSYPILVRRDLGDQFSSMLRPTDKDWFHTVPRDSDRETLDAKRWLERATNIQKRAMFDPAAKFTRATKEGDHDFATFGQCVISVRLNRDANALLYRCWHLRDVVWKENEEGDIALIGRKWKPTYRDLDRLFGAKNHSKIAEQVRKKPFDETTCYHIICEADMYNDEAKRKPYWSIYYDCENEHLIEAVPVYNREYAIPRWQTVSGSQYAFSPATIVALPDARLIQSMTYTLLEAGEKATNPPMIATQDAVRSDVSIYAGGITWVDQEYDERLGAALRPISQDTSGIPIGMDMIRDSRMLLHEAFYLNKLNLPERGPEMTAYEVGQRVQQYIRSAMPLFGPMEDDYNGALCELTFDILMRAGAFGSTLDIPASLRGADIQFRFESPLHDAIEEQKGHKLLEVKALIAEAMAMDNSAITVIDANTALRDALSGIKTPAEWINDEDTARMLNQQNQAAAQAQQVLGMMQQGSDVAATLSKVTNEA